MCSKSVLKLSVIKNMESVAQMVSPWCTREAGT
jgi:hypothetical protein